jgi:hypothetical protein
MTEVFATSAARRTSPCLVWTAVLIAVCVLANPLHEVGHWIGFCLAGVPAAISFDHTYFTRSWAPSFVGALGGPLMSVVAAWAGVALLYRAPRLQPIGVALALFMPMTRLIAYAIFASNPRFPMIYNDEGVMGLDTGLRGWTWVFILLPFLTVPLILLWRGLRWTRWRRVALIVGGAVAWYVVAIWLEAGVLDPMLFPRAQGRELVMPYAPTGLGH